MALLRTLIELLVIVPGLLSQPGVANVIRRQGAQPLKNFDEWEYQGCITEGQNNQRVFTWVEIDSTRNSVESCLPKCLEFGYMAAGLENGQECRCGDAEGIDKTGATKADEAECNLPCPGNKDTVCGAGGRMTWYQWKGDPKYVFEYPTDKAAGRYEFLVGGPIIPLISIPGIKGKVTLLEKHGSGVGNSTGAFEFDPSIGGDIFHAFRELQGVKTDIFCSAGLTLPDRTGRQITVGGSSSESLFGVRLYQPDGSAGVSGTNNWQEDMSALKLQTGRWYPAAMIMANGSILVAGGQNGPNGPPVSSLEILPQVGPIKEVNFLKDTDPNNLYPFLAVLPSGGILIQYYNEARILDEVTLETKKILPMVPAAMGDPTGGRTYPFSGTQMLLPLYYPYKDPLQIITCGGASRTLSVGLDNCVSIAPDSPDPKWTIERMPSKRVMPCMTTLPDGTFLIVNGAELGIAGFNRADSPNLNALLYDPRKPLHHRISVMANTTIARLYHSEAVLMDDGRVLITGSDPEDNGKHPQEYRVEVFLPPYLLSGASKPTFTLEETDLKFEETYSFTLTSAAIGEIKVSLLGSEASTHGNSMGARTLFLQVSCTDTSCRFETPPGPHIAVPGWYRMFVLDGPTPSDAKWVRIGGDPARLGDWPNAAAFQPLPGV